MCYDMWVVLLTVLSLVLIGVMIWQNKKYQAELKAQRESGSKRRENDLIERDQLLDTLGEAFLLVNDTSQIVFANAAAHQLVKGRKLMGRSLMETFLDDELSVVVMDCIKTRKPVQKLVELYSSHTPLGSSNKEGISAWMIDAAPMNKNGEAETLTRVVIRDVTAEHQAEQVRRDFVANASHELRTPMAIINGYLENLIDDDVVEDPEVSRKFLKTMRKHGDRIARLVEDMLMISKIESGEEIAISKDEFCFHDCAKDVLERLEHIIDKQGASVDLSIPAGSMKLTGDRFYWTQIIFNLVENALKQNRSTELQVQIKGERIVRENGVENLSISVCDDGIGIPSADLPFVFKRFYRVEKHHSQAGVKGTGLGLSIVKRAVEAHGGEIRVTSIPGTQTCFTITLPVESHSAES